MAIGPVTIWPGGGSGLAAMIADNDSGTVNPKLAGGSTPSRPETHSTATLSPDRIVRTGGNVASNWPILTVSGLAASV